VELAGFLALAAAVYWDLRLRSRAVVPFRNRHDVAHST
jgi:hypothetical protein